jgi:hypothetical protein
MAKLAQVLIVTVVVALFLLSAAWAGSKYKILHSFGSGNDGGLVASGLVLDARGDLYGTTHWGGTGTGCGSNGCGVAFELMPRVSGHWRESVIFGAGPPLRFL